MSIRSSKIHETSQFLKTKRSTPSPTKLSLQFSRQSTLKSPEYSLIYPTWLIERNDFQEIFEQYENIDKLDIVQLFQKPLNERKDPELQVIYKFLQSCYFFSNIFNAKVLIRPFTQKNFDEGENLSQSNSRVHIILKGKVLIDHEITVDKPNTLGEFSILEHKSQSLSCLSPVSTISVSEEDYKTLFLHSRLRQLKQIVPLLESIPCFSSIKPIRLEKIACISIPLQFSKNEEIFNLGQNSTFFYILISGKVVLSSQVMIESCNDLPIGMNKREKLVIEEKFYTELTTIKKGQQFGLAEVVRAEKRNTVATCVKPCVVYAVKLQELLEIVTIQEKDEFLEKVTDEFNCKKMGNMIKNKITNHKRYIKALMQASEIKPGPTGRETFEIPRRKRAYARLLFDKQDSYLKQNLVSKSYSFRDVILPKISRKG